MAEHSNFTNNHALRLPISSSMLQLKINPQISHQAFALYSESDFCGKSMELNDQGFVAKNALIIFRTQSTLDDIHVKNALISLRAQSTLDDIHDDSNTTTRPMASVAPIVTVYVRTGGNTTKPAHANAPKTHPTETVKRLYARESNVRKVLTTSPMYLPGLGGRAALAPTNRVAIANKKEKELKIQNMSKIG